jgi:thioredoxin reductase
LPAVASAPAALRPRQHQVPIVAALELALAGHFVKVDDEQRTSIPGIYAAGNLVCHATAR